MASIQEKRFFEIIAAGSLSALGGGETDRNKTGETMDVSLLDALRHQM